MCVIIDLPANKAIDKAMLAQACDINPDGYGVAWVDKGAVHVKRSVKNNDPKEVGSLLDRLKSHRRIVHLRYSTVGAVNLENNHPFVVLENRRGPQMVMFHNGTLSDYRPPNGTLSDTFCFNSEFVQPLAQRIEAFGGLKNVVEDKIFRRQMAKEIGGYSVIVLFDKYGNVLRFNESKGKQYETFWASNSYSFDKNHHRSSTSSIGVWRNQGNIGARSSYSALPWEEVNISEDRQAEVLAWEAHEIEARRQVIQDKPTIIRATQTDLKETIEKRQQFTLFHQHVLRLKEDR